MINAESVSTPSLRGKTEKGIAPVGSGTGDKKEKTTKKRKSKKEKKRRGIQVCSPEFSLHDPSMNYMLVATDACTADAKAAVTPQSGRRMTTTSVAVKVYDSPPLSIAVSTPVVASAKKKKLIARRPRQAIGSNQKKREQFMLIIFLERQQ